MTMIAHVTSTAAADSGVSVKRSVNTNAADGKKGHHGDDEHAPERVKRPADTVEHHEADGADDDGRHCGESLSSGY